MRRRHNKEMRRHLADQVQRCIAWLKVNGYEVRTVLGGTFLPRIVISRSHLCAMLEGVVDAWERTPTGERRYNFVIRFDCMIEWEAA